jgi:two-component system, chemotaxis family, response regulator WspR
MNSPIRVLHVEDNRMEALLARKFLETAGAGHYRITHTDTLARTKVALEQNSFDILLLDLSLPDAHGIDLLHSIEKLAPGLPIVVITGEENREFGLQVMREGAQSCLIKSEFKPQTLIDAIDHAIAQKMAEVTH